MLAENLQQVNANIEKACAAVSRDPGEVTLVAVSKTKPVSMLQEAYDAGARVFGENKVQEIMDKYDQLPSDIQWHMIGHLQRNKVKYIIDKVAMIHSVDSVRLAQTIEQEAAKKVEENKDLLAFMKDALDGKVKEVILSQKLKSHPVCLSSEGAISIEMEKVLNAMPNDQKVQAQRVLEINANHPIFEKLCKLYTENQDQLKEYAKLLYDQALLIEGVSIDDPVAFSNRVCNLMV